LPTKKKGGGVTQDVGNTGGKNPYLGQSREKTKGKKKKNSGAPGTKKCKRRGALKHYSTLKPEEYQWQSLC